MAPSLVRWWETTILPVVGPVTVKVPWTPTKETQSLWDKWNEHIQVCCKIRDLRPEWPAITAGGPRFVHSVRASLIDNLVLLTKADPEDWPPVPPETKHLVLFGRHQLQDLPMPTDATLTAGWAPNPGLEGQLLSEADHINWKSITRLTGDGVGVKALLLEYIRMAPTDGRALLERLEARLGAAKTIFGCLEKANRVVPVIRAMLADFDQMPPRPEGWVDLYREAEATKSEVERIMDMAEEQSGTKLCKALAGLSEHEKMKRAIKRSKKVPPTTVDRSWSLMRYVAPIGKAPPRMTPQMIATVGRTVPARTVSATRSRADSDAPTEGQRRSKRARTTQSRDADASNPMALLRAAVDADRATSSPSGSATYVRTVTVGNEPRYHPTGMTDTGERYSEGSGGS